jgi:hypothetical protein
MREKMGSRVLEMRFLDPLLEIQDDRDPRIGSNKGEGYLHPLSNTNENRSPLLSTWQACRIETCHLAQSVG